MNRPYITKYIFIVEILSYVMNFIAFLIGVIMLITTDGEIPTHYDMYGNVTDYGSPATLLFMPIVILFTLAIMTISLHVVKPENWNIRNITITEQNALPLYIEVGKMDAELMFMIGFYSLLFTVLWALNYMKHVGLLTVIFCVFLFGDIIYRMVRLNKYK